MSERELALIKLLLSIDGIGVKTLISLRNKFKTAEAVFDAGITELTSTGNIGEKLAKRILDERENIQNAIQTFEKELEKLNKIGAKIISYWDDEYTESLRNIYLPPVLLYLRGNTELLNSQGVAIVGTRKPTRYGIKQAKYFAEKLVENNLTVVSGLARGIDSAAHKTALENSGVTIAVLGNGLDFVYPHENKSLYWQIAERGLLVTEYPLGTKPDAQNFPRRNRIISGLSLGVLVVETKMSGGALHTAAFALEQGREVFAVPGNIDSVWSEGTNRLIQRGEAKLVLNIEDVLDELKIKLPEAEKKKRIREINISELDVFEQKIYEALSDEPIHIDKLAEKCGLSVADTSFNLLNMELKGLVAQLPGKYFVKG